MSTNNNGMIIAAVLVVGYLMMKSKAPAAATSTKYGAMPGNVGTGTQQLVGGVMQALTAGLRAPANGTQQDGNPLTQTNMANANYNADAGVQDQTVMDSTPDPSQMDPLSITGF